jgi:predicted kinase
MNQLNRSPTGVELAVFVGLQAAGKSTFYRTWLATSHALVSKDLLRNNRRPARRQAQLIEAALRAGRSIVVDNTNPTAAGRREVIELAHAHGARIVGYYFASTLSRSLARNRLRAGRQCVPEAAIIGTFKRLERPTLEEGFHELWLVKALYDEQFLVSAWEQEQAELMPCLTQHCLAC